MARSRSQFQVRGLRVAAMVTPLLSSWHHQLASSLFALALGPLLTAQATGLAVKSGESIAFLGDSITAGGARGPAGYCQLVIRGLALAGVKAKMLPAGVSGHKSNQMLARLQRDVLAKNPDWMTLSCGVNDVWHGKNGVPLEDYKKNITQIVDRAQAAGIKVMILTSTMIREDPSNEQNQTLSKYNAFLKQLVKTKGCRLADLYDDMKTGLIVGEGKPNGNQLTTDGVHMNTLGNIVMATGVLRGFGMSQQDIVKAQQDFESIPKACQVRTDCRMTVVEYKRLRAAATKAGMSIQRFVQVTLEQRVAELLKQ
jgi:lysophospholipase L1-like esterase